MKTKKTQHNVGIKENTTKQCKNENKNNTTQCKNKKKTPQHNVGIKKKHHNTMQE